MTITKCKECNKEISSLAKKCPHCGINNPSVSAKTQSYITLAVFFIIVIWFFANNDDDELKKTATVTQTKQKQLTPISKIAAQFISWDSPKERRHRKLESSIKNSIASPTSYEHLYSGYIKDSSDTIIVTTNFYATDVSNTITLGSIRARFDLDGNFIEQIKLTNDEHNKNKEYEKSLKENTKKAQIKKQFHGWDGSHIKLEKIIKNILNDPDSFEHVKSEYWTYDNHIIVKTTFRAKNAYNATLTEWVNAKFDLKGNLIEVLEKSF